MIGVLGGYGAIGLETVRFLSGFRSDLCVLGRDPQRAERRLAQAGLADRVRVAQMDVCDESRLASFAETADVLINCTGPSHDYSGVCARLAADHACHYIDLGMIEETDEPVIAAKEPACAIVHAAGMSQGLSGLLQRYILRDMPAADLTYCFGGISAYTRTAADDFVHGITRRRHRSMVCWQDGALRRCGPSPLNTGGLFDAETAFYPFFDEESDHMVRHCHLRRGLWCFAVEGTAFNCVMKRMRYMYEADPAQAVRAVVEASAADQSVWGERIKFYLSAGVPDGRQRRLTLTAPSQAALSAAVVAETVRAVLDGRIGQGVCRLAAVADERPIVENLAAYPFIRLCETETAAAADRRLTTDVEEGVLDL